MVKKTGWFIFFVAMAAACLEEPECFSLNNNFVGIVFKKMSNNTRDTVAFTGIGADGTDYAWLTELTYMTGYDTLRLNYFNDSTVFHFRIEDVVYELHLNYTAQAQFVSEDCGQRYVLSNLSVGKGTTFDSVRVVGAVPKKKQSTGTNIEIYRCPITNVIKLAFVSPVPLSQITADYFPAAMTFTGDDQSSVYIPLDPAAETSTITFDLTDGTSKTLKLDYTNEVDTLFNACGPQVVLSDLKVDTVVTNFTNVAVARASIQDPPLTNFAITF